MKPRSEFMCACIVLRYFCSATCFFLLHGFPPRWLEHDFGTLWMPAVLWFRCKDCS